MADGTVRRILPAVATAVKLAFGREFVAICSSMSLSRTRLILILTLLAAGTGSAYQSTRPWPPALQTVTDESPVLSAEASMKTFFMPPGYRVELVASEPLIEEPILIDWDPDGRLWVIEQRSYMQDLPATTERDPIGRISVLEDTNGDGRMDKRTTFMDGLVQPRALKVLAHGVLIGEPPNLWFARDTNGDLKADTKDLVTNTYGTELANVEHNANGLMWGLDNWMYTSEHNGYLRLKDGKFETAATLSRGQWGATMDDGGRIYRNTNEAALFVDFLPARYFMRNPNLLRTRGSYESLNSPEVNAVWPVRPTRGVNRGYQTGVLRPDGTLSRFTSVCAPTIYRGDRLPAELYGNVFLAEPAGNLVSRLILSDDGTSIKARKAYENAEFLASTDERFRPVYLSSAPDGTLYIVDMYHGIIQHKGFVTEYLRDQILSRKLDRPNGHGRIYRVVHDTTRRGPVPALSRATPTQLVEALAHPNGWWRDTAQRLLVEKGGRSAVDLLKRTAEMAADWRTRLHALWALDGLDAIEPATVTRALGDNSRDMRVSALQISERWLGQPNAAVQAAVLPLIDDKDWAVRRQFAGTAGALPQGVRETTMVTVLERFADDPFVMDAVLSGTAGSEAALLTRLLQSTGQTPQREAAVTMLAATLVKGGKDPTVQDLLQWMADGGRPTWQRESLLRGAEAALLGAALPGNPPRQAAAAASLANNAPGSRAGPGGAPAFPAAPRGAGGRGRGNANTSTLSLTREPEALSAMAATGGDVGRRAATLLDRVNWPGKTGVVAGPPPLSPAEQLRYNAGEAIYGSLCIACHQMDGRGADKLAPSLIGSTLALASSGVTARILLNGKEGPVGLMPPLGASLSDDQIADVLTFVRRQWGNTGSPVDAAAVKDARAATTTRTRPWTNEELMKLGGQ